MTILLIDSYARFSYNLYQLVGTLNVNIHVVRNGSLTVEKNKYIEPEVVILSPGLEKSGKAWQCEEIAQRLYGDKISIFGVCSGRSSDLRSFRSSVISYAIIVGATGWQ